MREQEGVGRHRRRSVADGELGDLGELGEAEHRRQRRVLGQVEVLVADRRHGDAHRLRQDHEPHPLEAGEGEGVGGLALSLRHRLDRTPHDLGDVAGRVDDQGGEGGEVLRRHRDAPGDPPPVELRGGCAQTERHPDDHEHDRADGRARRARCAPVVRCDRRRGGASGRRPSRRRAAASTVTTNFQLLPSYQNTLDPRTLITASGPSSHESSGPGKTFSTTAR